MPDREIILAGIVIVICLFSAVMNFALMIRDIKVDPWSALVNCIFVVMGVGAIIVLFFMIAHDLVLLGYL